MFQKAEYRKQTLAYGENFLPNFSSEQTKLLNKSFQTVALRTQIFIFTTSSEKRRLSKDEQFISAHFDTLFKKCQRYGHLNACGSSFKKNNT